MSAVNESEEYSIELLRVRDMARSEAKLYRSSARHYEAVEQTWRPLFAGVNEADRNWDWEQKQRLYGSRIGAESYALECEDRTQGLMLIETMGHRSWFESRRRIVYVHSIATAPWNRPGIQTPPEYRLVGSALLEFARYRSESLGYGGLVGLHALPSAEIFYRRLNMIDCGYDRERENMRYFEWYRPERQSRIVEGDTVEWDEEDVEERQEEWEEEYDV
jgi:hypothetical protein